MTEISWLVLLLFLPFCLNTMANIIDGLLDMKKPKIIVEERVSYKERVVYRDRVIQKPHPLREQRSAKTHPRGRVEQEWSTQPKPKSPTSPTVSNVIVDEVLIALLSLGIPKSKGKVLISSLVKSSSHKKYSDSETLLQDCIKSL